MHKRFSGVVVPMITPLNKDYTIDVAAVQRIVMLFAKNRFSATLGYYVQQFV